MKDLRILIVEDHKLFAEAILANLQKEGAEVLGIAGTGKDALEQVRSSNPDLCLVDVGLPDRDGIELAEDIREACPDTKIVMLTGLRDPAAVERALRAGFHGYITKDMPLHRFLPALSAAMDGQVVIPHASTAPREFASNAEQREAWFRAKHLTSREWDVLALLVEGADSATISKSLAVSPNTVRTHVQNILMKLQAHSRLEAATFAVRHRLIERQKERLG